MSDQKLTQSGVLISAGLQAMTNPNKDALVAGLGLQKIGFASRALFVTWALTATPVVGQIAEADGLRYRYIGTGTAIDDLSGWIPNGEMCLCHWGSFAGATIDNAGVVTGTDCTAGLVAMKAYALSLLPAGQMRLAPPVMKMGYGQFRISGSADFTDVGQDDRRATFDFTGSTFFADGANKIPFDFTGANHFVIINPLIIGSEATPPLCAIKVGRRANNVTGGRWTIQNGSTRSNLISVSPHFRYAALWEMASEEAVQLANQWVNNRTAGAGDPCYAAAYDNMNWLNYEAEIAVTSCSAANPSVITATAHGYVTGDKVVATVRSVTSDRSPSSQTTVEGKIWTVTRLTADTFTLANSDGAFSGVAFVMPSGLAFCKERFPYSEHIGNDRPEPLKPHSQGTNVRQGVNHSAAGGKAAILQGQVDKQAFNNTFMVGPVGYHLVHGKANATNQHWTGCMFDGHVEEGSGDDVTAFMLIDAVTANAEATSSLAKCVISDRGLRGTYLIQRADAGQLVSFTDCDIGIYRGTSDTVVIADDPTKFTISGGSLGLGRQSYNNIPEAQTVKTVLSDYELALTRIARRTGASFTLVTSTSNSSHTGADTAEVVIDSAAPGGARNRALYPDAFVAGDEVTWVRTVTSAGALTLLDHDTSATLAVLAAAGDWARLVFDGDAWALAEYSIGGITATGAATLTNKSINWASNTITMTKALLNAAVSDGDVTFLDSADTLTNKSIALGTNTITGTTAEFDTAVTGDNFAYRGATQTLTGNNTFSGETIFTGSRYTKAANAASYGAASTIAAADLGVACLRYTGAVGNMTFPLASDIDAAFPAMVTNTALDVSVMNTGSGTVTLVTNTGLTLLGGLTVAAGASGIFRIRKTGTAAYTIYRIS